MIQKCHEPSHCIKEGFLLLIVCDQCNRHGGNNVQLELIFSIVVFYVLASKGRSRAGLWGEGYLIHFIVFACEVS